MKARIREWVIAVVWLGALIALYRWHGGSSVWFLIMLTAIFMVGGLLLQWFGAHHIEINRTVNPTKLTVGKAAEVEVHIQFRSILPLPWMSVTDYFTEGSYSKLLFPGWRRSFTYTYSLQNLPRGIITYQVCHVEWGGLFRCFKNSYLTACDEDIIVLPNPLTFSSEGQSVRAGEQVGHQRQRPDGVWGLEVRDYSAGDPMNRVHWKSSARRGRLQTRLLEETEEQELSIVLDHCSENYTMTDSKGVTNNNFVHELFEGAVSAAAGLLRNALEEGIQAELIVEKEPPYTPIGSSFIYDSTLATIEPNGTKRLADVMEENTEHVLPGTRVALVTGRLHDELIRATTRLLHRGLKVEVYSIYSTSSLLHGQDAEVERIKQGLERIGVTIYRINVSSAYISSEQDRVSGKEVNNDDSAYTEWKSRYI